MINQKAVVVGAGIVGLAVARSLAVRGWHVTIVERRQHILGASIRNFGMVWPIGQPVGKLLERALRSRSIWIEIADSADIWYEKTGSLLALQNTLELRVAEDFVAKNNGIRECALLSVEDAGKRTPALKKTGLLGALWSPTEVIVDPREALPGVAKWLATTYGVRFLYETTVKEVHTGNVTTESSKLDADLVVVCSGEDLETLFSDILAQAPITRCKLQMMRTAPQPSGWHLGSALCAGLTLTHYASFADCEGLDELKAYYQSNQPEYVRWGIHVMASQMGSGEVTLGDSHEYGPSHDPFDKAEINRLILRYLETFTSLPELTISETWHGIYAKMINGATEFVSEPAPGVWIINGLGGAGMTLSFGLAEEWAENL